jgi:hypothetical protein
VTAAAARTQRTAPVLLAGWRVLPAYAEPASTGGYVELHADTGLLEVAYESDQSMRDMGIDTFLLTRVPVEVLRSLLRSYDARREAGK